MGDPLIAAETAGGAADSGEKNHPEAAMPPHPSKKRRIKNKITARALVQQHKVGMGAEAVVTIKMTLYQRGQLAISKILKKQYFRCGQRIKKKLTEMKEGAMSF